MSGSLPQGNLKILETLFRLPLPLQRESCLFLIVNVLDVMMTWLLINDMLGGSGRTIYYESNPVARYFLNEWGPSGFIYFKFAMVAFIEVIAHIIAVKKIEVGRRLLEFGTLAVSLVVIYSMYLLVSH